jgi:predicted AAA+ superfamily ATPase
LPFYNRYLKMDLPERQSAFLWGARKTGKSTYLKHRFPHATFIDLLQRDQFLRYNTKPHLFREEIIANPSETVVVDEIQKVPALLDEIHWLIENTPTQFILCGSSARQLKRQGVNVLGGRAWRYQFFPLVFPELPEFNLLKILTHGLIPSHYDSSSPNKSLEAYLEDYIIQEIQAEGLVRNLPAFSRFMDALRFSHGEMINYTNIARDAGVDSKSVQSYFTILVDTLMGYFLYPYSRHSSRKVIRDTPKFYLFDVGVASYIKRQPLSILEGVLAGQALEHYILMEIMSHKYLNGLSHDITYWRTKTGLEVDFIMGEGKVAIEVKISSTLHPSDLKGIKSFMEEYAPEKSIVVCQEMKERHIKVSHGIIEVLPVENFLEKLWAGKILPS